jgi:hypothetical protein
MLRVIESQKIPTLNTKESIEVSEEVPDFGGLRARLTRVGIE